MDNRTKVVVTVFVVVVCIVGLYVAKDRAAEQEDDRLVIECSVDRFNEFGCAVLTVDMRSMDSLEAPYGTDLYVEFNGSTYTAIFVQDYSGVPSFSMFVSFIGAQKEYVVGVFNGHFSEGHSISVGDTVRLSVAGPNPYYSRLPNYLAGYSNSREDYPSDQVFANYRMLGGGDMAEDKVYRCSTPWGLYGRGELSDEYLSEVGVERLIGMDRSMEEIADVVKKKGDLYSSHLFLDGKVSTRFLSPSVHSHPEEIGWVIDRILDSDGSVGLFCKLGKDRTGIYCLILQALAGATLEEATDEFMLSFTNFYWIMKGTDEYDAVYETNLFRILYLFQHPELIDSMLDIDWSKAELVDFDLQEVITGFLIDYIGIPVEKIDALKAWLTG
jgi:hypothetical protein